MIKPPVIIYSPVVYIIFFLISLPLFSCSHGKDPDAERKTAISVDVDLLQMIQTSLHEETQQIDFSKSAEPERYFLQGWGLPKDTYTWADSQSGSLLFYTYDILHDIDIDITCRALPSPDGLDQKTVLWLNDTEVGGFTIPPGKFETFHLSLPASALRSGQNILKFRFSYTATPENMSDRRTLAAVFRHIVFHQPSHLIESGEQELLQHADSAFQVFAKFPKTFELIVQYELQQGAASNIMIHHEHQELLKLELPRTKDRFTQTITLPEQGIYTLRFATTGDVGAGTLWKQFTMRLSSLEGSAKTVQEGPLQGFSKLNKPDILLYVVDTLRADHVGCYGYERDTTPNLDRFAAENTLFMNGYTVSSWTKPGGASLLTGLLPKNHRTIRQHDKLPDDVVTLAEILQDNGYETAAFMTNANVGPVLGFSQGFEKFQQFAAKNLVTKTVPSAEVNQDVFAFLDAYLTQKDRKPLFMLVWMMDPHAPYTPPDETQHLFEIEQFTPIDTTDHKLMAKIRSGKVQPTMSQIDYMKTRYDQEIYSNDRSFQALLERLKQKNIYDDMLIFFTSDHGEEFWEHGSVDHGISLYNEIVKVPFVLKAPQISPGVRHELVQLLDVYPTFLDILGIEEPYQLDGISLLSHADMNRRIYFEQDFYGNDATALLKNQEKFIFNKKINRPPTRPDVPIFERFDLDSDSAERYPTTVHGAEDQLTRQDLLFFRNRENTFGLQRTEAEIPPELAEELRDLGYVQ